MAEMKSNPNKRRKKGRGRKILIILALVIILVVVISLICARGGDSATEVNLTEVETGDIISKVNATGRVKPKAEVNIQAEIYEIIVEIPVEEGDSVNKGDLLVRLKQTSYQFDVDKARANLKTAEANLEQARSNLEYWDYQYNLQKELFNKGQGSEEQLISAKDKFNSAKASVASAEQSVEIAQIALNQALDFYEKTEIVSPIDGIVTDLNYEVGERTMIASPNVPGAIIMTVADLSVLEVEVRVDETDIKDLEVGQEAEIVIDAFPDTSFAGVVTNVGASAQVTGAGFSEEVTDFLVTVQLLNKYDLIKPNLTAEVDIITGVAEDVKKLPIQAIVALDELPGQEKDENSKESGTGLRDRVYEGVFIYDNGTARFRQVELGIQDQADIEIKSGLEEDETVIMGPYRALRTLEDGDQVVEE
ncbi:MAG: efflux RND transporter periplasmic adaptor subunit [candidate division Zixibacteria bacterium]|nr:efflux RND transporter periplasmic adaptor subunit [candidate division Zixibacteria bacterium]